MGDSQVHVDHGAVLRRRAPDGPAAEMVRGMVRKFVEAAEHQYKVVGPDATAAAAAPAALQQTASAVAAADQLLAEQLCRESREMPMLV